MKNSSRSSGFTLVEMLITVGMFSIISLGTAALFKEIYSGSTQKRAEFASADQARLTAASFTNELRNASLGNDGSFPLGEASTTEIIFFTSYGATAPAVNRVRYFSSGNVLYKGVTIPTGTPLDYDLTKEKITIAQASLSQGSSTLFSYYTGSYAGTSTPLSQPVNVNQVAFVQMNLTLLQRDQRNATSTFSITAGAAMRTLKTNLGN